MAKPHSISRSTVEHISTSKGEPQWMTDMRLEAYEFYASEVDAPKSEADRAKLEQIQAFVEPPETSVPSREWPQDLSMVIEERGDEEGLIFQRDSTVLSRSISKEMTMKGVVYTDLATALRKNPELVRQYFAQQVKPDELFSALNTAFWSGGTFLRVPAHVRVQLPFHTCYWMTTPGSAVFPRTILIAEKGSSVTLVDDFLSVDWEKQSLAVSTVELFVEEGAFVTFKQIHHWGKGVHHENRQMSSVAFGGQLQCSQVSDSRPVMTLERAAELYPEVR